MITCARAAMCSTLQKYSDELLLGKQLNGLIADAPGVYVEKTVENLIHF